MTTKKGVGAYPLRYPLGDRHTVLPLSYKVGTSQYNQQSADFATLLTDFYLDVPPTNHEASVSFGGRAIITANGESVTPSAAIDFQINSVLRSVMSKDWVESALFNCEAGIKPTTKTVTRAAVTTTTANQASYTSDSFTPVADDWLIVFVLGGNTDGDIISVTDSQGIGFTEIISDGIGASHGIHIFGANAVASPVAMTVTFNCEGGTGAMIYVARVGGTNRNVVQSFSTTSNTDRLNLQYNMNTNNLIFAIASDDQNPANVDPPTGFTELEGVDSGFDTPSIGTAISYKLEGNSGDSIIIWNTPAFYTQTALEIGTISADATTKYGATTHRLEAITIQDAGLTFRDSPSFIGEAILTNNAGTMTTTGTAELGQDLIVGVRGNIVMNSYEDFVQDSIITGLGGMAVNGSQVFVQDSVLNSLGAITMQGTTTYDEEANIGVVGNIAIGGRQIFVDEGNILSVGNLSLGSLQPFVNEGTIGSVGNVNFGYLGLRLDEEAIIISTGSVEGVFEVLGSAKYDLEAIITSVAALQMSGSSVFAQEGILGNNASLTFIGGTRFDLEGNYGSSGNIIFNPQQSYLNELQNSLTGNLSMQGSQVFTSDIIILSSGTTATVSIVSGAVVMLLEAQTAQTGNILLGQSAQFNIEAILTNVYSVDIGASVVFPNEGILISTSTALMGGMVVFTDEVQLTATVTSNVLGSTVILLEAQLTADGLRQMVSNQFSVSVNMAREFHVELTIPDLEIVLNHQSPIEAELTINRTFPVILTINMGRSI